MIQPVLSQTSSKLNTDKRPSQYILKGWSTEDGLTSESTNDMVQTNDGYIWIGTYTGLHRFDGKDFTVFTTQNSDLPSSNILRMDVDQEGRLWLGTLHGVVIFENEKVIVPSGLESVTDYSIEEMHIATNGDVWFSSKSNHLFQYTNGKLIEWTDKFSVKKSTVLSIVEGDSGMIYLGTDDSQLLTFNPNGEIRKIEVPGDINGITELTRGQDEILIGTGKGLFSLKDSVLTKSNILSNTSINTIVQDAEEILWVGTMKGLYRYQATEDHLDSLTEEQGLPNNIIRTMIIDDEGNFWAGTYRNGVFFLSDGSITSYTKNDGLHSNVISNVTELERGTFLLGNENGKINILSKNRIETFLPPIPLPNARLKHLFTDNQQRVWVSTYGGLYIFDGNKGIKHVVENGFPDNFVRLTFQHSDGSIWVGTKNAGLLKFDGLDSWESIDTGDGLTSDYIMSISENSQGQLIVGTISGLNILEDLQVIKTITIDDGLPSNFSFSTYPTDRYTWIATNDGLVAYSEKKTFTFNEEHGMPSKIIYDVIGDENGNLWMPGEKAILKTSITDLEKTIESGTPLATFQQFDRSNGMKNSHCLGGVLSYVDASANFWIPTQMGIVNLKPNEIEKIDFSARPIIEGIFGDNVRLGKAETSVVPAGISRLGIDFTGISYRLTDKLEFRYKLSPFDQEWVPAGDERNALYTNLPPGNYNFQLQMGLEGTFVDPIVEQAIILEATWWQSFWARALIVVFIISLGFIIYLARVRSLTKRNKRLEEMVSNRTVELENQKQELSAALIELSNAQQQMVQSEKMASLGVMAAGVAHEINNPLNFIKGGLWGLEKIMEESRNGKPDESTKLLSIIKDGVDRATQIVQSLNEFSYQDESEKNTCEVHHIIENCIVMLQYDVKSGIKIEKAFDAEKDTILGNSGKIHQAILNIMTNAIHALNGNGAIMIETLNNRNKLEVRISDDGVGINKEDLAQVTQPFYTTKQPGEGTGLGLSITYSIVKDHNGTLDFTSVAGKGTTVVLKFPLHK